MTNEEFEIKLNELLNDPHAQSAFRKMKDGFDIYEYNINRELPERLIK